MSKAENDFLLIVEPEVKINSNSSRSNSSSSRQPNSPKSMKSDDQAMSKYKSASTINKRNSEGTFTCLIISKNMEFHRHATQALN